MKKKHLIGGLVAVFVGAMALVALAEPRERPEKEPADKKELRHKKQAEHVDHLKQAVKDGKIDKARGEFMLRAIAALAAFQDTNPDWVKFMPRFGGKMGPGGKPGMCKDCKMHGGKRGEGMRHKKDGDKKEKAGDRKRPDKESDAMKALRHKGQDLKVERLNLMVKEGFMQTDRLSFALRALAAVRAFQDANPDWVKYGRQFMGLLGQGGHRMGPGMMHKKGNGMHKKGGPDGKGGRGCADCKDGCDK